LDVKSLRCHRAEDMRKFGGLSSLHGSVLCE